MASSHFQKLLFALTFSFLGGVAGAAIHSAGASAGIWEALNIDGGDILAFTGSIVAGAATIYAGFLALGVADREKRIRDAERDELTRRALDRVLTSLDFRGNMLTAATAAIGNDDLSTMSVSNLNKHFADAAVFLDHRNQFASGDDLSRHASVLSSSVEGAIASVNRDELELAQAIFRVERKNDGIALEQKIRELRERLSRARSSTSAALVTLKRDHPDH